MTPMLPPATCDRALPPASPLTPGHSVQSMPTTCPTALRRVTAITSRLTSSFDILLQNGTIRRCTFDTFRNDAKFFLLVGHCQKPKAIVMLPARRLQFDVQPRGQSFVDCAKVTCSRPRRPALVLVLAFGGRCKKPVTAQRGAERQYRSSGAANGDDYWTSGRPGKASKEMASLESAGTGGGSRFQQQRIIMRNCIEDVKFTMLSGNHGHFIRSAPPTAVATVARCKKWCFRTLLEVGNGHVSVKFVRFCICEIFMCLFRNI